MPGTTGVLTPEVVGVPDGPARAGKLPGGGPEILLIAGGRPLPRLGGDPILVGVPTGLGPDNWELGVAALDDA